MQMFRLVACGLVMMCRKSYDENMPHTDSFAGQTKVSVVKVKGTDCPRVRTPNLLVCERQRDTVNKALNHKNLLQEDPDE